MLPVDIAIAPSMDMSIPLESAETETSHGKIEIMVRRLYMTLSSYL